MIRFIHIPKAGGTSLRNLIQGDRRIEYLAHCRITDIKYFAFVRNPYDRMVSTYFYLIDDSRTEPVDIAYRYIIRKYLNFREFILNIGKDNLIDVILHLKPMHYWVCDGNGTLMIDNIFKIEETERINEYLCSLGIAGWDMVTLANTSVHQIYTEYLDQDIIKEINRIYEKDFLLFNYTML